MGAQGFRRSVPITRSHRGIAASPLDPALRYAVRGAHPRGRPRRHKRPARRSSLQRGAIIPRPAAVKVEKASIASLNSGWGALCSAEWQMVSSPDFPLGGKDMSSAIWERMPPGERNDPLASWARFDARGLPGHRQDAREPSQPLNARRRGRTHRCGSGHVAPAADAGTSKGPGIQDGVVGSQGRSDRGPYLGVPTARPMLSADAAVLVQVGDGGVRPAPPVSKGP
jgi:hypothetical protein